MASAGEDVLRQWLLGGTTDTTEFDLIAIDVYRAMRAASGA